MLILGGKIVNINDFVCLFFIFVFIISLYLGFFLYLVLLFFLVPLNRSISHPELE